MVGGRDGGRDCPPRLVRGPLAEVTGQLGREHSGWGERAEGPEGGCPKQTDLGGQADAGCAGRAGTGRRSGWRLGDGLP